MAHTKSSRRRTSSLPPPFRRVRLTSLAVLSALPALAQAQVEGAVQQSTVQGTVIQAQRIEGRNQVDIVAQDEVRLQRGGLILNSDRLFFDQISNEALAQGNVRLRRGPDTIEGPRARINLDTWFGEVESPTYLLQRERRVSSEVWVSSRPWMERRTLGETVTGSGQADLLYLEGENHYRLSNSTFTTCPAPDPSWYLRMRDLQLDFDQDKGRATDTSLVFQGVPILYTPWAEFPLSGGRQSGFLPPTLGTTSLTGVDLSLPYYFNLAPNYDATLAPRWMTKRGVQLGGETRYLTSDSHGVLRGEYMNQDCVTGRSRDLWRWQHDQDFGYGLTASVDATRVSDKTYFSDLSSKITSTSQSTLNQQATLNYNNGTWLSGGLTMQRYQVLSGTAPYDRLPQLSLLARNTDFHGLSLQLPMEYTAFSHPTSVEGRRAVLYPQVSLPVQSAGAFFTPKFGVHLSQYQLDRRDGGEKDEIQRGVPIASLDSGLVFERPVTYRDKPHIQTLEPRLYYVRSSYWNQSDIPVFDSTIADFNFSQIFSENRYVGQDRIADSNQLTSGLQSRLIDDATGEEWLRGALAQRYYFADQRVLLPGEAQRSGSVAHILGGLSGRLTREWWLDTASQYDHRAGLWERATLGMRYQPDHAKAFSVSYRFYRDQYRDLDVSAQWPLWKGWYGVGRYNLNLRDHRLSEAIAGLEYKGDCWVLRTVWHTLVNNTDKRNNAFYIQLEFNGLASVGSNPVDLLKRSVGGYGKINDPGVGNSVFSGGD
ncbi:MAG: LPS biosynthesis protein [Candidatus Dactylopiibacterium carminicum]|uniref:LPS-assembly protein LptD n=1 Tax=Candidatus Dactylopiibacterium carminicum TaxID=857335 RepID=A0A272EZB7_9RHOO|nr:LPS-assembly protein LptD [Candidatus Dactylopiibacterium carminicum]KAF7600887.1 LPS-assembly protein LptD [Candidatus Dactylopiibacterium carminicum]PAS95386.1 MAG: LPS biosynthesis protein [Candidatus Dactylopiibacterium carminicum]